MGATNLYELSAPVPSSWDSLDILVLISGIDSFKLITTGGLFDLLGQGILNRRAPDLILLLLFSFLLRIEMMEQKLFEL